MIKAGIVGATGYTGSELIRILTHHPDVSIRAVTSESHKGKKFSDIHPQFVDLADLELVPMESIKDAKLDVVFLALPHAVSMKAVKEMGLDRFKIVDLSGDFRFKSAKIYQKWYRKTHVAPDYLHQAVFGLPELYRSRIRPARLVANPGCYPTSAILALAPLLKRNIIEPRGIVVDSKSGVSGAGTSAKPGTHFPKVFGDFKAYSLLTHRHSPEMECTLQDYTDKDVQLLFTPHLLPVDRGILTTTYSKPKGKTSRDEVWDLFLDFYKREQFVRLVDTPPGIKDVRGSNFCDIHATYDARTNTVITVSVIDNLVKGAAGQAVQNMNIMFNLLENKGLRAMPLSP